MLNKLVKFTERELLLLVVLTLTGGGSIYSNQGVSDRLRAVEINQAVIMDKMKIGGGVSYGA